jgi:predicted Zn-ribbon and HTH transcriptional regulator
MSEEMIVCWKCGFKCVKSQIYKTGGKCPRAPCQAIMDMDLNAKLKSLGATNA